MTDEKITTMGHNIRESVDDVEPLWDKNIFCCHTFNYTNGLTVVDGMTKRSKYFG
jgi:hypothetical protein